MKKLNTLFSKFERPRDYFFSTCSIINFVSKSSSFSRMFNCICRLKTFKSSHNRCRRPCSGNGGTKEEKNRQSEDKHNIHNKCSGRKLRQTYQTTDHPTDGRTWVVIIKLHIQYIRCIDSKMCWPEQSVLLVNKREPLLKEGVIDQLIRVTCLPANKD